MNTQPWLLQVGKPYSEQRTQWTQGFEFRYFNGHHQLQICVKSPTQKELDAFDRNPIHLGLYIEKNVVFFLFKIESFWDWSDQGISIRMVPEEEQDIPEPQAGTYTLMNIVLVNADTGIIEAMRAVTFSPNFSAVLTRAFRQQLAAPFDRAKHVDTIAEVYARYPHSKQLAKVANVLERAGSQHA